MTAATHPIRRRLRGRLRPMRGRFDHGLLLAMLISLLATAPLFDEGYFFKAHDARHSVYYVIEFVQSLRDGVLWPRWGADYAFGYGYPLYNVYAPLAFFTAALFLPFGLGFVGAVKATYVVVTMASAASMYLLGRRLYGPPSGLIAAAVYSFIPYRFLDLYVRNASAEFFALLWPPLILWAFLRIEGTPDDDDLYEGDPELKVQRRPTVRAIAVGALALSGLVLSHNASFLLFVPFLFVPFLLWRLFERRRRGDNVRGLLLLCGRWAAAGALAIGLTAIFLLPVAFETRFVKAEDWTGPYEFQNHFAFINQYFSPYWGFGFSNPGPDDGLGLQFGLAALVLGGFAIAGSPLFLPRRARRVALFFGGMAVAYGFLMSTFAFGLWQVLPGAALVQFPWRLLGLTAVVLGPLAGAAVAGLEARIPDTTSALRAVAPLLMGAAVAGFPFVKGESVPITEADVTPRAPIEFEIVDPNIRTGTMIWATAKPQTSPMVEQYRRGVPPIKWQIDDPAARVEPIHHGGESDSAKIVSARGGKVTYLTYDYPGWQIQIDGRPIEHTRIDPYGLMAFDLPPGEHTVASRFGTTQPRTIGTGISIFSVLLALLLLGPADGLLRRLRLSRARAVPVSPATLAPVERAGDSSPNGRNEPESPIAVEPVEEIVPSPDEPGRISLEKPARVDESSPEEPEKPEE